MIRGLLLFLFLNAVGANAQTLELIGPNQTVKITLAELKKKLKSQTVEVQDILYHKKMSFEGFSLSDVLALIDISIDGEGDELLFSSSDGYTPSASFQQVKNNRGFVTFQESGRKDSFSLAPHGKSKIDPGPFYIVWTSGPEVKQMPWSFQLIRIEVVDWKKAYSFVLPKRVSADSQIMKGFLTFKANCIRCHSINLQGGEIGPELNAPRNVTEYWTEKNLREFIPDAGRFRYKSKMPPFKHLTPPMIEELLEYLKHMKAHKIASPGLTSM